MINPTCAVTVDVGIDHPRLINVKIKRVIRLAGVMWVAAQGLLPVNNLTNVFDEGVIRFEVG